jgi:hypothetical protein
MTMNSFRKLLAAATILASVSLAGTAMAEGEYQYVAPAPLNTNFVGGGRTVVINTGNPDNPLQVVHLDDVGAQRPVGGRVATIQTQDMSQPVYVLPNAAPSGGNPIAALANALFGSRARG